MRSQYDAVVVGGGPAGLSGALALARARRSVLVVDAGEPRNAPAGHVHNYLGREGTPPGGLLAAGRAEVAGYGGELATGTVTSLTRLAGDDPAFAVDLAAGPTVRARRLVLATGLADDLPAVPGVAGQWGRGVVHCPYCHGWEIRDRPLGVLGTGPMAGHQALLFRQWTADLTLFTHTGPQPGDDEREQLTARGIGVVDGEVAALETAGQQVNGVRLVSGQFVPLAALAVAPVFRARDGLLAGLGLAAVEQRVGEHVVGTALPADPTGATAVPGVWAAGNLADLRAQVISSAAAGLAVGAAVNADLVAEDTRRAVAAHRQRTAAAEVAR